jgi:hypothetical protein
MKKSFSSLKKNNISSYLLEDSNIKLPKSTNVNILLNRVKNDQKLENRKKIIFSTTALAGLFLFGIILF